jgi:ribosomal-protein-alanine N-acetyltransferase
MSFMCNYVPPLMAIREFRPGDLARLHEIDAVCFDQGIAFTRAEMAFYVRQDCSVVRIAEREGDIVGFAIGRVEENHCGHVITIDVMPQARRSGVGSTLLKRLHEEFRSAGVPLALLEVDVANGAAQSFYEGFGYRRIEILEDYYGSGRDAYRMVCSLS